MKATSWIYNKPYTFLLFVLMFIYGRPTAIGQREEKVIFVQEIRHIRDSLYEAHITALLANGWHIYAMRQPQSAIAIPTTISFAKNPLIRLEGKVKEIGILHKQTLGALNIEQIYFLHSVEYIQVFTKTSKVKTRLIASIDYEACTDENCLPPAVITIAMAIN